jgi:hypothetical protein
VGTLAQKQAIKTPTLGEILQRLQGNLDQYDTGVPSFFCDERAISQVEPGLRNQDTVTDSVFRLKRNAKPDHTTTFEESREVKTVNGQPATKKKIDGPSIVDGAFEGGLAVVSLNQTACMNYTLQRTNRSRPSEPYVVRFTTVLTPQNTDSCLLQEESKGRVSIDPASMQITHLEITTPHHTIIPAETYSAPVVGERVLTVDYAPVVLDGKSFWMPATITSNSTSDPGTFHSTYWTFRASYRNYHKLEVTSRILPGVETEAK